MSMPSTLIGANGVEVVVTEAGELVTAPLTPNLSVYHKLDTINTAYSFAPPVSGKSMRLQHILVSANKNVGTNDATITIYKATSADSITPTEIVMEFEMGKNTSRDFFSLNLDLGEGVYLNAKTDDNDIFLTIVGYYG